MKLEQPAQAPYSKLFEAKDSFVWRNRNTHAYSNMACCDQFYETNGDVKSVSSCAKFEHAPCSPEEKVIKVWNDMRVSKCWPNLSFH